MRYLRIIYDEKLENIDEQEHYRYDEEVDTCYMKHSIDRERKVLFFVGWS